MILDSTVIISLGLIGKLELLEERTIPTKVFEEIITTSIRNKLLDLKFQLISPTKKSKFKALEILGDETESGDSDVVAFLLDNIQLIIATDDRRLRNVCRALGGRLTGTLGIIIHSVELNKISKEEAFELLTKLNDTGFRMSLELFETAKKRLNAL